MTDQMEYRSTNQRGDKTGYVGFAPFDMLDDSVIGKTIQPIEVGYDAIKRTEIRYEGKERLIIEVWHPGKHGEQVTVVLGDPL